MDDTFEAAADLVAVDTRMTGRYRVTSAYLARASEPALIETGPTTSADAVTAGLESLGLSAEDLAHIVVTHIHLDHAGGAGTIAERFPSATVWVHERGARHLADPSRLWSSAAQVYGGEDRLVEMFGPMQPIDPDRIRSVAEGDRIDLGDRSLDVMYTPGHASHHVSLVDSRSGALFTGDALGIHFPDVKVLRPATPPPDIDVELAVDSIGRIRARAESALMFSHFGPVREVDELCAVAADRIRVWAGIIRDAMEETEDLDRIAEILAARTDAEFDAVGAGPDQRERYEVLSSTRTNAAGLVRYWNKRREREAAAGEGSA
ncbi:MAG TPA: MBL fold metallo-hydrolase [Actinomycetota bacterium]|jgi:glyoxylase-like metal-dependent hydrolase (beta-lactamase superfamily II)